MTDVIRKVTAHAVTNVPSGGTVGAVPTTDDALGGPVGETTRRYP
jgi:hypothetical protein